MIKGDTVTCIDAVATRDPPGIDGELTHGAVYTVRWVGTWRGVTCVRLKEIDPRLPCPTGERDAPFAADRFRPQPNIDMLRELLVLCDA